jgi:phage terminase large subunit-like protein
MPWQETAARYLTAQGPAKKWLYRSVAVVVARQNGKTELLLPLILMQLGMGRRILHTAQNRALPRATLLRLAVLLDGSKELSGAIRYANGQESIEFKNGGRYTLVAPRPGVRGNSVDTVLLDEVREQRSFDLMGGIKPTMTASQNPQIIYLSNAGDEDSVVLNDLRRRADSDPALAYLEWSASPDRANDDRDGWAEANPALGITIQPETLEDFYASMPAPVFETEHLCRWVITMQPRLVSDAAWMRSRVPVEDPRRTCMGISTDAIGRASAAVAWQQSDGTYGLRIIADVTGSPLDIEHFGDDLRQLAKGIGVSLVGFDDWTDKELAKYFKTAKPIIGKDYSSASANFVRLVDSGKLHWEDADQVTDDLMWTARKPTGPGEWMAVKAKPDRPITAVLAAIRAVALVSGPPPAVPRVM